MAGLPVPLCIECGNTDNPCRCKFVGPTLAFLVAAGTAVVAYPVGALTYLVSRKAGGRLLSAPVRVHYATNTAIPI